METSVDPGDQTWKERGIWRESEHQCKTRLCVKRCWDQTSWAAVHTEQLFFALYLRVAYLNMFNGDSVAHHALDRREHSLYPFCVLLSAGLYCIKRCCFFTVWSMCFVQCVGRVASGAANQAFRVFIYIILYIYMFTNVEILPRRRQGKGVIHTHKKINT